MTPLASFNFSDSVRHALHEAVRGAEVRVERLLDTPMRARNALPAGEEALWPRRARWWGQALRVQW